MTFQQSKHLEEDPDREQYEEIEFEDKVWCVNPIDENSKIWVIHQVANKNLRRELAT